MLVHGFASSKEVNWVHPGWVTTLTRAGRRVIALDNRGHGASTKLYDPAAYHSAVMAEDVRALLDHLGIERADVMGYSMGARIAAFLALAHPQRVRSAILGGLGIHLVDGAGLPRVDRRGAGGALARRRVTTDGRMFRAFAEQTKSRPAGARGLHPRLAPDAVTRARSATIRMPVLIAVGSEDYDRRLGRGAGGAACRARRRSTFPGRDHMLAVGDKVFKQGVLDFLAQRP